VPRGEIDGKCFSSSNLCEDKAIKKDLNGKLFEVNGILRQVKSNAGNRPLKSLFLKY
jgi:hypothetical protein